MTFLETHVAERVGIVSLIDRFAQVRGTRGFMPVPIEPLRFWLVAREEQAVMVPLERRIELKPQSGPTNAYLFNDEGRFENRQRPNDERWFRVTPGVYRLRIESAVYQALEADLDWPAPANTLLFLRPSPAYPFPDVTLPSARITLLRGSVLAGADGTPVANATVTILNPPNLGEFTTARTDVHGAFVLAFRHQNLLPINATVRMTVPNQPVLDVPNVVIQPGQDNSLLHTALRGAVLSTRGNPIRDAEVSVDLVPNTVVRSDRHGRWAFYFGLNQPGGGAVVTATAPNGQNDVKNAVVVHRRTVVVDTFRIVVN